MQYTENLNLNKPGPSDQYNIQHFNDNFDVLDSHVHALEESAGSIELELTEKINEAEQFSNMQGVCPINKGGTGANSAQTALNNLHGSVQVTSDVPDTAEVTFINHTPADPQEGTPEIKDVQAATMGNFSNAVYEKIRGDTGLFSQTKNGLVPKTGAGETVRFLSSDGIWRTPDGASTVYEATTSQSWEVNADTILRIRGNCTSVIGNASIFGTKLIVLNETNLAQTVALLTAEGSETLSIPAGDMKQYIWVNYWREQEFGGGDTYSTIETRVGTWIDGKPVYRITVDTPWMTTYTETNAQRAYTHSITSLGISNIVSASGTVFFHTVNSPSSIRRFVLSQSIFFSTGTGVGFTSYVNNATIVIIEFNRWGDGLVDCKATVTIEYTKA